MFRNDEIKRIWERINANIPLHFELRGVGAYIRNNIFVGKWMSLYRGGGFKVGFYGTLG